MAAERDPSSTSDARLPATFRTTTGDDTVTVHVSGELDASSGTHLRSMLTEIFEASPSAVVIDLGAVTFVDSVGLSVLVTGHNRAAAQGATFEVHDVPEPCLRVFEITRLTEVLVLR